MCERKKRQREEEREEEQILVNEAFKLSSDGFCTQGMADKAVNLARVPSY